jgi:hypothetical protein
MIRLTDSLYIGGAMTIKEFQSVGATAILNVAYDMAPGEQLERWKRWPDVEYTQVGLINGPGNEVSGYYAAVLALSWLLNRHEIVVVYDHQGELALVVAAMYLNVSEGKLRPSITDWSYWPTWNERMAMFKCTELPNVHEEHKKAFNRMSFGMLEALLGD